MYDLKSINSDNNNGQNTDSNSNNREISDRTYFKNHLTDNILYTKSSYVPTDTLF
ncbi:hypothetical protein CPJCM30710_33110 [Clostridium polyendosporum]|uniref:Uncharacterized protein n=1 Tax=Clostridium polyendosporum TaxID=69208 RepID=A0A919VHR4_9CLOT|nr:hypothetical protein [Clostridium polyendosporum]GIM30645.1 hypothetical protein CPJCM30710_33110 [Clostridium polyendosporum]